MEGEEGERGAECGVEGEKGRLGEEDGGEGEAGGAGGEARGGGLPGHRPGGGESKEEFLLFTWRSLGSKLCRCQGDFRRAGPAAPPVHSVAT